MKILQISSDYFPKPLWGMGWHVSQLTESLKKQNHDVFVATAFKSRNYHDKIITTSKAQDSEYLSSGKYEIFNNYKKFNIWQEALADEILKINSTFDIVHCHNWMSWLTAKKLKERNPNIKIVITFHFLQKQYELMTDNPIPTFHHDIIEVENDAILNADHIIILSDSQENLLYGKYNKNVKNKVTMIPHSVNFEAEDFETLKKAKNTNPYLDILFTGRIENDKGITETLIAANNLLKRYENVRLHVAGDGPLLDELVKEYKNPRIIFHGYLGRKELKKLLLTSQIFCMPSSSETLSLSVLEAMFFAIVPVFTKGETVPSLFKDKVHGLKVALYKTGERLVPKPKDLEKCLEILIKDEKLRDKMSYQTYRHAYENYSLEAMIKKVIKLYETLHTPATL